MTLIVILIAAWVLLAFGLVLALGAAARDRGENADGVGPLFAALVQVGKPAGVDTLNAPRVRGEAVGETPRRRE